MERCRKVSSAYERSLQGLNVEKSCRSLSLRKPYASVHARDDSQEDSEDSVAKAESRCLSDAHTKWCEAPEQDGKIDEGLILKFENDVDQVASELSVTSKVVSETFHSFNYLIGFGNLLSVFLT